MFRASFLTSRLAAVVGLTAAAACAGGGRTTDSGGETSIVRRVASALGFGDTSDSLDDVPAIPHYTTRSFTSEERDLLRTAFGIEDPAKLYVADSTDANRLKYDTQIKRCISCYVNSYAVGFISVRRPGETWEQAEARIHRLKRRDFPVSALVETTSLDLLDPEVRPMFEAMLNDAKEAAFPVRVVATYRSPEREAFLMSLGGNRTHTLTSMHSYGRAIDVSIGDGNIRHPKTRAAWIAFRRWLAEYDQEEFRLLGGAEHTWDWRHIEVRSNAIGFRSIDAAIDAARRCTQPPETVADCTFRPNIPAAQVHDGGSARGERSR